MKSLVKIPYLLLLGTLLLSLNSVWAARIDGYKFHDLNGNGVHDLNEPTLANFRILLQSVQDPSFSREELTDSNGEFLFNGLPTGSYQICELAPEATPAWVPTTPECLTVRLRGKNSYLHVRFGNWQPENGPGGSGCTRTQGYWGSSPAGQLRLIELTPGGMNLGNRNYSSAELDDVLDTAPVGGNALVNLAHQLIAAKLNILNGADGSAVSASITSADTLIGNLVSPSVGSDMVPSNTVLGQQMNAVKDVLDDYNNGMLNVPHCN